MHASVLKTDAGHRLLARYRRTQNSRDLDQSIKHFEGTSDICPVDHPYRPAALFNLASAKFVSCQANDTSLDLDIPISIFHDALDSRPTGHPDRPITQLHLAIALLSRFAKRDDPHALDEVISLHDDALGYYSAAHAQRGRLMCSLGAMMVTRFERRGNSQDLDKAIALHREALAFEPIGHPTRSISLNNLARALLTRFKHRGNGQDLDEAITLHSEALALCPVGHPDRSSFLSNLGALISTRFNQRGNVQDLNEAIAFHREGLALRPVGHPDRFMSLNNLGNQLSTRFDHRGNVQDLDEATALQSEALALCPVGHSDRSAPLNNLANRLSARFRHRGNVEDLDEAIALCREGLVLCPVGHSDRPMILNNLANKLWTRFDHRGDAQDLDEAIALVRGALALCPLGHPDRSMSLDILANGLSARFERRCNDQDLDEAIALHREALTLRPVGHPARSISFNNLANHLYICFKHRGNGQDLDEAIALHRKTLALRPAGHPDQSMSFHNLAHLLSTRFEHRGNGQDLKESLENSRCALNLLTQHDPRQTKVHMTVASAYLLVHQSGLDDIGEDTDSLNASMHHFKAAANILTGGLLYRLRASLAWVRHAAQYTHGTELEAYATSMQLFDAYMSVTASVSSRHHIMKDFPITLAVDAASCALRRGDMCRAVELLEQGRTLIWTQMARFRTPLDSLQKSGDRAQVLMMKFRDLSSLLESPHVNDSEGMQRVNVEAKATRYRRLVEDWNTVVEEIRKLEGFSRFLLPPLFSDLQDAACDGPIIVLVASKSSCDAIIIWNNKPPTSIQLPTDLDKLRRLAVALQQAVHSETGPKGTQPGLIKALRELWDEVVHPVVQILHRFAGKGSRIWWCPTSLFNFLPLHAAGEYKDGGKSLSQLYVSSYTPSLTALIKARKHRDRALPVTFIFFAVCRLELDLVGSLLPPSQTVSFTKVTSNQSTKSMALRTLRDNHWIHLSCHGTQNFQEPFKSAFLMRDEPLQLLDIRHTDLSQHEFAFLSACETAVGAVQTPDEAIHLAAGLQFSGVKSVIGTFWNVDDSTVQRLVEAFYKNFCGDGKMNSKRAARALHKAVQSLASDKDVPLDQRIVFMHIGL
ncbi:CHAT domain-containing protein [Suillus paluster]|uniref:CHAT domain-containing protein n=1 Tax=Suillus paluster TaxID=48578 RepID=UPI001B8751B2|nr:CHAT domain-containing protein [Suillus paluster]KAG1719730.1 CHAT domain-containing protein [Suillus paluster]